MAKYKQGSNPAYGYLPTEDVTQTLKNEVGFLATYPTEELKTQHFNYKADRLFRDSIGKSPFKIIDSEKGLAVFDENAEKITEEYLDPKKNGYAEMHNKLVFHKGALPEDSFAKRTFSNSMTAGWVKMLGLEQSLMGNSFELTEQGIRYDGDLLQLSDNEAPLFSKFMQRVNAQDREKSFGEKLLETSASLLWDLPLMAVSNMLTSAMFAGELGTAVNTFQKISSAKDLAFRSAGRIAQSVANFELMGLPQTVTAARDYGVEGVTDQVWHNAVLGTMFAASGELGKGVVNFGSKSNKMIAQMLRDNPAMKEELGGLLSSGSMGAYMGYQEKGDWADALASSLSFMGMHFTNPRAMKRVVEEFKNTGISVKVANFKNIKFGEEHPKDVYYDRNSDGSLTPIDAEVFRNTGEKKKLSTGKIENPSEEDYIPLNEALSGERLNFEETLGRIRIDKASKRIVNKWIQDGDLTSEKYKQNKFYYDLLGKQIALSSVSETTPTKKIRLDDINFDNLIVDFSNNYKVPYHEVKEGLMKNLDKYLENPKAFFNKYSGAKNEQTTKVKEVLKTKESETKTKAEHEDSSNKGARNQEELNKENLSEEESFQKDLEALFEEAKRVRYKQETSKGFQETLDKIFKADQRKDLTDEQKKLLDDTFEMLYSKQEAFNKTKEPNKTDDVKPKTIPGDAEETMKLLLNRYGEKDAAKLAINFNEEERRFIVSAGNEGVEPSTEKINSILKGEEYVEETKTTSESSRQEKSEGTHGLPIEENGSEESTVNQKTIDNNRQRETEGKRSDSENKKIKPFEERIKEYEELVSDLQSEEEHQKTIQQQYEDEKITSLQKKLLLEETSETIKGLNKEIEKFISELTPEEKEYYQLRQAGAKHTEYVTRKAVIKKMTDKDKNKKVHEDVAEGLLLEADKLIENLPYQEDSDRAALLKRKEKNRTEPDRSKEINSAKSKYAFKENSFEKFLTELGLDELVPLGKILDKLGIKLSDEEPQNKASGQFYPAEGDKPDRIAFAERIDSIASTLKKVFIHENGHGVTLIEEVNNVAILNKYQKQLEAIKATVLRHLSSDLAKMEDVDKNIVDSLKYFTNADYNNLNAGSLVEIFAVAFERPEILEYLSRIKMPKVEGLASYKEGDFSVLDYIKNIWGNIVESIKADKNIDHTAIDEVLDIMTDFYNGLSEETQSKLGKSETKNNIEPDKNISSKSNSDPLSPNSFESETETKPIVTQSKNIELEPVSKNIYNSKLSEEVVEKIDNSESRKNESRDESDYKVQEPLTNRSFEKDLLSNDTEMLLEEAKKIQEVNSVHNRKVIENSIKSMFKNVKGSFKNLLKYSLPPVHFKEYSEHFKTIYNAGESMKRLTVYNTNRILLGKDTWNNNTKWEALSDVEKSDVLERMHEYSVARFNGELAEDLSFEEFKKWADLTKAQSEVMDAYQKTIKESIEVLIDGNTELMLSDPNFVNNIDESVLKEYFDSLTPDEKEPLEQKYKEVRKKLLETKRYKDKFKRNPKAKSSAQINADEKRIRNLRKRFNKDLEKKKSMALKEYAKEFFEKNDYSYDMYDVVRKHIEQRYEGWGDNFYYNMSRPNNPETHIIDAVKKDSEGNETPYYTYTETLLDRESIVKNLQELGYEVEAYQLKDKLNTDEYKTNMSEMQLLELANRGDIPFDDKVVQKLLSSLYKGVNVHRIHKRYIPGMKFTEKEFVTQLHRFVREAVNAGIKPLRYRQMELGLKTWQNEINTSIAKGGSVDKEMIGEVNYARGYINQLRQPEKTWIDEARAASMAWQVGGLKPSFLLQQALQVLQTGYTQVKMEAGKDIPTANLLIDSVSDAFILHNGLIEFRKGGDIDAFIERNNLPADYKDKLEAIQELEWMEKVTSTGIADMMSLTPEMDYQIGGGVHKKWSSLKKIMAKLGSGTERLTRLSVASMLYEVEKAKTKHGSVNVDKLAEGIDKSMGEWGKGGRAPLLYNKTSDRIDGQFLHGLRKSAMTYKTFSFYNYGQWADILKTKNYSGLWYKSIMGLGLGGIKSMPLMATVMMVANMFLDEDDSIDYEMYKLSDYLDESIPGVGSTLTHGVASVVGVDMSDMFSGATPLPTDIFAEAFGASTEEKIVNTGLGAPISFVRDIAKGTSGVASYLWKKGVQGSTPTKRDEEKLNKSLKKLSPAFLRNVLKGMTYDKDGIEIYGNTVVTREDLNPADIYLKIASFPLSKERRAYEEIKYDDNADLKRAKSYKASIQSYIREIRKSSLDLSEKNSLIKDLVLEKGKAQMKINKIRQSILNSKTL